MNIVKSKSFKNGTVYCLRLEDGMLVETTDTFLPYYTKDAIGRKQNFLDNNNLGSRAERWMIGVSTMSGCPVRCKFCATGNMKKYRNLTADEIVEQVLFAIRSAGYNPNDSKEFKINYTRMGEPFLNIEAVKKAIERITEISENRGILYNYPQVDQAAIDILHQQNIFCGVWSVDDTETAQKYIDYGVDFIVTNEIPARINHMVNDNE